MKNLLLAIFVCLARRIGKKYDVKLELRPYSINPDHLFLTVIYFDQSFPHGCSAIEISTLMDADQLNETADKLLDFLDGESKWPKDQNLHQS